MTSFSMTTGHTPKYRWTWQSNTVHSIVLRTSNTIIIYTAYPLAIHIYNVMTFWVGLVSVLPVMASVDLPQSRGREPVARAYHAAIGYHRYMAVWGGDSRGVHIETSVVECFDVLSATWMEARQLSQYLPDGLYLMAVACDEERAYTLGGETDSGRTCINDVYEVDLTSLVCSKIEPSAHSAPSPSARSSSAIVISRRRLVNYGGNTGGRVSDELHVLDLDASE